MTPTTGSARVEYRLLGPETFDETLKDWRAGYAIERVERVIVGEFATRDEARAFMIARDEERSDV